MSVVFTQGQTLGRKDLNIFLYNTDHNPTNAYSISFAIYYVDPSTEDEVLIGSSARTPVNPAVGEYYAAIMVPASAQPGDYRIRWTFQESSTDSEQTVVQQWGVVAEGTTTSTSTMSACQAELVRRLRVMLRDNNPDKNYHFRPPEHEGTVGCYNQVFGYIWEDDELLDYLLISLDKWNMQAPETEELSTIDMLCSKKPSWRAALLWGAVVHAAMALSFNWVADEFSIGGNVIISIFLPEGKVVEMSIQELWDVLHEAS